MLQLLLLQVVVIAGMARLLGRAIRGLRQPQVIGEMISGILLGPSLLGWITPSLSQLLFPPQSIAYLGALSQIGLVVFMFLVGLELDTTTLKRLGHSAVMTSHVSIAVPFFFGVLLSVFLYPRFSDNSVPFSAFALFMGAAMSITAFPVLARILTDTNTLRSKVGLVAVACAAVDDVTAWFILAGIIVIVRSAGGQRPLATAIGGSAAYIALMLFGVRRMFARLMPAHTRRSTSPRDVTALMLLVALSSACVTEWLGIHALFGAFLAGAVIPKDRAFISEWSGKLDAIPKVILLPLFFAVTGLRTRISLLGSAEMWACTAIIVAVAVAGKLGGSMLAARVSGMSWREAGAIGVLMNTRGLMELVIMNIGFEIGVISPALFSMMVVMALATTLMTSPLLGLIYGESRKAQQEPNLAHTLADTPADTMVAI
jgi:Kef-type K+ transport system membrane component KefB